MKIIRSITEMSRNPLTVITTGTFDGVHLGHQTILQDTIQRAKRLQGRSVIVTFDPHPREVVGKGPVELLSTLDERLRLFEQAGIDETFIIHFTPEFSRMTARMFYEDYLIKPIGVNHVVIGHDHYFGHNREGSIETLRQIAGEIGFEVTVVPGVSVGGQVVSSSLIRKCLLNGDVETAAQYLGRPHTVTAEVVEGDKRGRQIGFPTANLSYDTVKKMTPANGVYVVSVQIGNDTQYGMLNIGIRPTFKDDGVRFVEVHLLDFSGDLYGKTVTVSFMKRLRDEQKFNSIDGLINQLQKDRQATEQYVSTLIQ